MPEGLRLDSDHPPVPEVLRQVQVGSDHPPIELQVRLDPAPSPTPHAYLDVGTGSLPIWYGSDDTVMDVVRDVLSGQTGFTYTEHAIATSDLVICSGPMLGTTPDLDIFKAHLLLAR